MVVGKLVSYMLEYFLTPYIKTNSKWIKDLHVRPETVKALRGKHRQYTLCYNHSKILSDPLPRLMKIKRKINKWGLIKLRSFCTAKETIKKMKRRPSEWEKIIPNKETDKGFISKI